MMTARATALPIGGDARVVPRDPSRSPEEPTRPSAVGSVMPRATD
jgi:hypothetical protein